MTKEKGNYLLSAGFYALLQRVVEFLFGFFSFYFLVRILSKEDFGLWILYITVIAVVDMARNGFLQNGFIKYIVDKKGDDSAPIQTAAIILNVGITIFCALVLLLLTPWLSSIWKFEVFGQLIIYFFISLLFYIPITHVVVTLQARMDFKKLFWVHSLRTGLFFLLIIFFWWKGEVLTLSALAIWQTIIISLVCFFSVILAYKSLYFTRKVSKEWMSKLFHFGKYVFGTNLMSMVSNSLDKFVLGALLTPAQVAINNVAGRILNFIEVPINTVAAIAYPKSAESMALAGNKAKAAVRNLFNESVSITLAMTVPFFVLMMVLARPVIVIVAGDDYLDAVPFFRIILVVALLRPFDRQSGVTLDAIGKPQVNFLLVTLSLILTLILSFVFIKVFGLLGAAYAIITSLFISVLLKLALLTRYLSIDWKQPILQLPGAYAMILKKILKH